MAEGSYEVHWLAESEKYRGHVPEQNCQCGPELKDGVWTHRPMKGH